jgi:hypothetical protein
MVVSGISSPVKARGDQRWTNMGSIPSSKVVPAATAELMRIPLAVA